MAPPGALVERRVQIWGTELTSEEPTAEVVRVPRATVPPKPAKVPSQAEAAAWLPTLKVRTGSTEAEMLNWSSSTIVTMAEPLSLVQVIVYVPATDGFVRLAPVIVTVPVQAVLVAVRVDEVKPKEERHPEPD